MYGPRPGRSVRVNRPEKRGVHTRPAIRGTWVRSAGTARCFLFPQGEPVAFELSLHANGARSAAWEWSR